MSEKTCAKCGRTKPLEDFPRCRNTIKEYVRGECRACRKERRRIYYETNRERLAAQHKGWREANSESRRIQRRSYYEKNREWILVQNRSYQKTNKEWLTLCKAAWRVSLTPEQYLKLMDGGRCEICGNSGETNGRRLSVDHDHTCCPGVRSCGSCIRGVICNSCNVGISRFKDDPNLLAAAAAFLLRRRNVLGEAS